MPTDTTMPSNSSEMLKSLFERYMRLESERVSLSADIRELGQEITSAGFSHRALKKLAKAKMDADAGKPKTMERLREDHNDLALYLDVLAPAEREAAE